MARSPRGVSSSDDLQGFSDTWRAYLAKTSSFWMHGGDILPRTGVFPVRGPFKNASGHNLAIARHRGTHFASILPPPNSRKRVEDICAYPNASVDAATVDEPGGTAASGRAAGALPLDGGGTRTATWGRGGRSRRETAASGHLPLSAETAGRRHALRQGGTAAGVRCVRAAGGCGRLLRRGRAVGCVRGHGMEPSGAGRRPRG